MSKHCTACGKEIGGGKMGMSSHWNAHRRQFFRTFQRQPYDNTELRIWVQGGLKYNKKPSQDKEVEYDYSEIPLFTTFL